MDEKSKMPNFWQKQKGKGWLKDLLITILGTSIGVGLTFTADRLVDSHKQEAARRETAIMAVCDIDEIVQGLKDEIQLEDSLFQVAMYVMTHQELIDSLSMDTLDMTFKYLYDDPTVVKPWTANTKENAFNSGMDARMNLGNNQFYDNVQQSYYVRRSLMKIIADAPMFQHPIRKEAYEDFLYGLPPIAIDATGNIHPQARRDLLKSVFTHKSTSIYIKRFFMRKEAYQKAMWELGRLNRENKMLMDIKDEDIETYLKKYANREQPQNIAEQIIGKWECNLEAPMYYTFNENNSFEYSAQMGINILKTFEEEDMEVLTSNKMTVHTIGRWELRGDTLLLEYDGQKAEITDLEIDTSNYPQWAIEEMEEDESIKIEFEGQVREMMLYRLRNMDQKDTEIVSFDNNGNTMIWINEEITPAGNKQTTSKQLNRKPS